MIIKVIDIAGFTWTYDALDKDDAIEAWDMVEYLKGVYPNEIIKIEVE